MLSTKLLQKRTRLYHRQSDEDQSCRKRPRHVCLEEDDIIFEDCS